MPTIFRTAVTKQALFRLPNMELDEFLPNVWFYKTGFRLKHHDVAKKRILRYYPGVEKCL